MADIGIIERIDSLEHEVQVTNQKIDRLIEADSLTGWKGLVVEFREMKEEMRDVRSVRMPQRLLGSAILYLSVFILTTTGQGAVGITPDIALIASTSLWVLGTVILSGGKW